MKLRLLLLVVALAVVCSAHWGRKEDSWRRKLSEVKRFSVEVCRNKCQIDRVNALKSKLPGLQMKGGQWKISFRRSGRSKQSSRRSKRSNRLNRSLESVLKVLSECCARTPKPTTIALPRSTTSKDPFMSFWQWLLRPFQRTTARAPTTASPKRSTAAPKPTTGAPKPTTGAPKPTPAAPHSTTAAPKPTAVSKPTTTASKPTTPAPKPTAATAKPTTAAPKPTTAASKPTTIAPRPTTAASKPTTAASKPTKAVRKSTTPAPKPTTAAAKPTTATPKPKTAASKPTTAARKSTTPAPKPTTAAAKPTTAAPKTTTAAPGTTTTAAKIFAAAKSSCDKEKMVEASISLIKWEMFTDSISNGLPCFPDKSACKADVDICIGYQAGRRTCDLVNFRSEIISNGREIAFNDRIPSWTPVFPDLDNPIHIEFDRSRSINMFVSLYNYDDNPVVFTIDRFDFDMPDQTIIFHKERMVTLNGTRTADKTKLHLGITYGCKVAPIVSATQL